VADTAPLRVLLVSPQCVVPEYRKRLEYLAREVKLLALAPREFLDVFRNSGDAPPPTPQRYELRELDVYFRSSSGTRCLLQIPPSLWKAFQPDIVHVEQEIWSLSVFEALAYRRLYSPRARIVISTWENLPRTGLKGALLDRVFELVLSRASLVLSVNADGERWVRQHGAVETRVIPQIGVDPEKFCPQSEDRRRALRASLGIPPNAFVATFVGRLAPEKGIADVLSAWARVSSVVPNATLLLVGEGPLRRLVPAGDRSVMLLPPVPRGETAPFFQVSDISVLASRSTATWKEQFGLALLESMSCGVPVVGSSSGAIPEVLGDGGLLFPEGDVAALAECLLRLARDPGLRRTLSAKALDRIGRFYTNEAVAEGILKAYRSVPVTG
jgi:glycosyltransferase involved in cell wall biosynthesis